MCSNYRPVTRLDRLLTFFGVERARSELPPDVDVYPLGLAPFIRLDPDGDLDNPHRALVSETAMFGLLPDDVAELQYGRKTYNARSETVDKLRSYMKAWAKGQRCIIPAECFYEPSYETGRCVWWSISQAGGVPMGIAGIYNLWTSPDGVQTFTMSMITVNAEGHPVMQRFHKPGEERRMVTILDAKDYGAWLTCPPDEAKKFFLPWMGPLDTTERAELPRPVRRRSPPPKQDVNPGPPDDLFA